MMECGCHLALSNNIHGYSIAFCPLHKAAPLLLEAMKGVLAMIESDDEATILSQGEPVFQAALDAIAATESG